MGSLTRTRDQVGVASRPPEAGDCDANYTNVREFNLQPTEANEGNKELPAIPRFVPFVFFL